MSCHSYAFVFTFGGDVHLATLHSSVILAVINNKDKVVTGMAICVNLIVHVFCYYISSILLLPTLLLLVNQEIYQTYALLDSMSGFITGIMDRFRPTKISWDEC